MFLPFAKDFDPDTIHVQAPSEIVFLCGGQVSKLSESTPLSLRDAFFKILDNPVLRDRDLVLAEDITASITFFDDYDNILAFETDFAQIVELIILFCESEGSLAELGAFAMIEEIASRLFIVIRQKHWDQESFVTLGPLRHIKNTYGREYVFVIEDSQVGINDKSAAAVDKSALNSLLQKPIAERLEKRREPTTFSAERSGHVIKLVIGLVQEYGALTLAEIVYLLALFNVTKSDKDIQRYLMCAQVAGWLKKIAKGSDDYFVAVASLIDAATLTLKETAEVRDKVRRRFKIREYWKNKDSQRYSSIGQVVSGRA